MGVYVDTVRVVGRVLPNLPWIKACHMIADTDEELLTMARRIGLRAAWVQGTKFKHFDLVPSKREAAVAAGALELDNKAFVAVIRRLRAVHEAEVSQ